ncbi:MAG: addiction module protein [Saprospiraceae bacterium]|nr:addiction module protein [Saprospiraceae bacterium]
MSSVQIAKKIDMLPEMLQLQVSDFVEFLLNKHFQGKKPLLDDSELTSEQKAELDSRFQAYLENPDSVVSMDAMKTRLMQKYGLSTAV